ncbi:ATP-binding protein [Undibacterium sp. LX40W]|uniref:ATP-binding protein n=1 Tax=Undibacterium nitidum TaxID=2762298 RepID=A0A923HRR2_9BURK|nr:MULTISPECIES: ATP-binding protein [Undibacterium]MBC3879864.1 ATP-binding protein [Undibacterium nitidum]MBC3891400.1 ATP-binding protein [Undibacterium sp. LX40W]
MIQKIAILGAESSGKSVLAEALARRFKTIWVPEYLREFVDHHQRVPRSEEQLHIAQTQRKRELELSESAKDYLFCDTTPLMTALYSRHYFEELDPELLQLEKQHDYAFTIVTAPDFPWTADGLQRESPAVRQRVHEELLDILDSREIPFMLVEGALEQRITQVDFALQFLN